MVPGYHGGRATSRGEAPMLRPWRRDASPRSLLEFTVMVDLHDVFAELRVRMWTVTFLVLCALLAAGCGKTTSDDDGSGGGSGSGGGGGEPRLMAIACSPAQACVLDE